MKSIVWGDREAYVSQPYGCTEVDGEPADPTCPSGKRHCGIDIGHDPATGAGLNKGDPIFPARGGEVIYEAFGIMAIAPGNGQSDWYVHGEYTVTQGQTVTAGQQLGVCSDRAPAGGACFGAHLHFEVQNRTDRCNVPETSTDPVPILLGGDNMPDDKTYWLGTNSTRDEIAGLAGIELNDSATPIATPVHNADIVKASNARHQALLDAVSAVGAKIDTAAAAIKGEVDAQDKAILDALAHLNGVSTTLATAGVAGVADVEAAKQAVIAAIQAKHTAIISLG